MTKHVELNPIPDLNLGFIWIKNNSKDVFKAKTEGKLQDVTISDFWGEKKPKWIFEVAAEDQKWWLVRVLSDRANLQLVDTIFLRQKDQSEIKSDTKQKGERHSFGEAYMQIYKTNDVATFYFENPSTEFSFRVELTLDCKNMKGQDNLIVNLLPGTEYFRVFESDDKSKTSSITTKYSFVKYVTPGDNLLKFMSQLQPKPLTYKKKA